MHDIKLSNPAKEKLVLKRLKRMLSSAYLNIPYYRKIMKDIGYNPIKDFNGIGDLKNFPILTKNDLKDNDISLFLKEGRRAGDLFRDTTSGSTGIPLTIYRDRVERAYQIAKWLRVLFVNGYSATDKIFSITMPKRINEGKTFLQKIGLLRRYAISASLPISEITDSFLEYKPDLLYGNRSHIDLLAIELLKRGTAVNSNLKLVFFGAEVVSDYNRNLYKKAFRLDALEFYGSVEMGIMAFGKSGKEGLVLCDDLTFFEFLDENNKPAKPGEIGRIVVTDLMGKTMPFIRYYHGDSAIYKVFSEEGKGPSKRIVRIIGRDSDMIVLPDESYRSLYDFHTLIGKYGDINQFQIIQKKKDFFLVNIATDENYFDIIIDEIRQSLSEHFPESCNFNIIRVDKIECNKNGKISSFVSELKHNEPK